ncbi:protein FAM227B isoform 1-T1 [Morphnus guianensis]
MNDVIISECSTWERRKSQSMLTMLPKLEILRRNNYFYYLLIAEGMAKLISLNEPYSLVGCQIVEELKSRNVETCNYPGSKVKQLSELPRHLEAPELWDLVIKAQHSQVCTLSSTILNRSC